MWKKSLYGWVWREVYDKGDDGDLFLWFGIGWCLEKIGSF